MDLNDIPLFVQVVEAGSFTAAAAALGVQKSAVSRGVSRLEEELGVRLLQRTTRKLSLTEAGKAFFERARSAVSHLDEAADAVREQGGELRGVIRFTAPADANEFGVADAIAVFCQKYPGVHVECALTARRVDLVAEGFDIAIRAGQLEDSTLVARRLGAPARVLFAAPAYVRRRGRPKVIADLAKHECILFRSQGTRSTWTLTGPHGDESVDVTGPMNVDNVSFAASACVAGAGVALLPTWIARKLVEERELAVLLPDYAQTTGELSVVLPSSSFVPLRVALLRDQLVAHIGREVAEAKKQCMRRHAYVAR